MITIQVPATIANMGPGFDSFGMAVGLYNRFRFEIAPADQLRFTTPDASAQQAEIVADASHNILFKTLDAFYTALMQSGMPHYSASNNLVEPLRPCFSIEVDAEIPIARGLGSSSTAIIAALTAANLLNDAPFSQNELLGMAILLEGHPDNVAPALLGGVVLYDEQPYRFIWPEDWRVLVLSPGYPLLTETARACLPKNVPMADSVFNLRKSAVLTYALLQQDADALRASLQDRLHQPYRRALIKEYDTVERHALNNGALGVTISGSGSSMAVFYPTVLRSALVETMQGLIVQNAWDMTCHDVAVDLQGVQILTI